MPLYGITVEATTNSSAGTEDVFVELSVPASHRIWVEKCRITPVAVNSDANVRVRLMRASSAGSGGISGGTAAERVSVRDSGCTINIKDTTVAFTAGTLTDTLRRVAFNASLMWQWFCRTMHDGFKIQASTFFVVLISASAASVPLKVVVEWEE